MFKTIFYLWVSVVKTVFVFNRCCGCFIKTRIIKYATINPICSSKMPSFISSF